MPIPQRLALILSLVLSINTCLVSAAYTPPIKNGNAKERQQDRKQDRRQEQRQDVRQLSRQIKRQINRGRHYRNIYIFRPFGHVYPGYARFTNDHDAYKWLAFTAISLKLLDNINEDEQRKHEAAQIAATTAAIGAKTTWNTNQSSGYVIATKESINASGLYCREFQQTITVGGKSESAFGTACLQQDGAWKISS